jgi:hypothetical protein
MIWPVAWVDVAAEAMAEHDHADWGNPVVRDHYRGLVRVALVALEAAGAFGDIGGRR